MLPIGFENYVHPGGTRNSTGLILWKETKFVILINIACTYLLNEFKVG